MRDISDGLGSGVTPEQLEASVELGNTWLNEIKLVVVFGATFVLLSLTTFRSHREYDFSDERAKAIEHKAGSLDLVERVRDFSAPVGAFEEEVGDVDGDIERLGEKLSDLRNNSESTAAMVRGKGALSSFFVAAGS